MFSPYLLPIICLFPTPSPTALLLSNNLFLFVMVVLSAWYPAGRHSGISRLVELLEGQRIQL